MLIRSQGFTHVRTLSDQAKFGGVTLNKTGGQHGTDKMFASPDLAKFLGPAMGVVFQAPGHKTLYLVGDTIWRDEIDQNLKQHEPKIVVINAGYARSEEHTSELQSLMRNSYADFCLKKKNQIRIT